MEKITLKLDWLAEKEKEGAQGRLVRSLVHEISNPVQAISSALTLLEEDRDNPEDWQEDLDIARRELRRLDGFLRQIRRLYKQESGEDVHLVLRDVLALMRKEITWRQARVEVAWDAAPLRVPPGCASLRHVLINLLFLLLSAVESPEILLSTQGTPDGMLIQLRSNCPLPDFPADDAPDDEAQAVLVLSRHLLAACGGTLRLRTDSRASTLEILLPNPA